MIYVVLALILVIFIFAGYIFFKIIKLKDIDKSLNLCSVKINELLGKKLEIIKDMLKKLNNNKLTKNFSYRDDFSLIEKEKNLFDVGFNINKYLKNNDKVNMDNELQALNIIEENLDGLKDFYNANVLNYNEIFLKKYLNKLYRLFKFNDYKSFKIRKLEEYEIFKN